MKQQQYLNEKFKKFKLSRYSNMKQNVQYNLILYSLFI